MTIEDEARAEAEKAYPGVASMFGIEHTTSGRAFIRGYLAASRREASEHDCEFGCASDLEHLQRAYDELKAEYAGFRRSMRGGA